MANATTPVIQINEGNVGIGTTTPGAKLEIKGKDSLNALKITDSDGGDGVKITSHTTQGTYFQLYDASHTQTIMLDARVDNTSRHTYFNGGGNVGIGTTNPGEKLEINPNDGGDTRNIKTFFNTASVYNPAAAGTEEKVVSGLKFGWYSDYYQIGATRSGDANIADFVISDTGQERLIIKANGDVGIGGSVPSYLLDVRKGTVSGAIARFSAVNAHVIIESSTAGPAVLHLKPNTTGNKSGQFKVTTGQGYNFRWSNDAASTAEVSYMKLDTSTTGGGDLTVKGDIIAYGAPSDRKYKENIKPIESALDKAMQLQGVTFDWKESDSILDIKEDIGFIAQDVEKVLPELVRDNGKGNLSLRYQGITPILLEAIKELKEEIEELKKQIK